VRAGIESAIADRIRGIARDRPVIVAGSLVDDPKRDLWEDDLAIHSWVGKVALDHRALLVLAPRHPENFKRTEALAMPYRYVRASDWNNANHREFSVEGDGVCSDQYDELEIIVLDTIGDLAAVYAVATIAFVGGSLAKRGGHNPLEPAQFSVPILMGPSFENFREITSKLHAENAVRIVETEGELENVLLELLANPDEARAMGERGRAVFESQQGATQRAVDAIVVVLSKQVQP
jgi:3-deoxy-D-manno-octulosonic-acid transferase